MSAHLDQLVTVTDADVYKCGEHAARLSRAGDEVVFSYLEGWRRAKRGPVATTLPVVEAPVRTQGGAVPAFFAGQLPEGRRLSALRRAVKTSADDELSLLLGVGADVVGDVQVVPAGTAPGSVDPLLRLDRLEDLRFTDVVHQLDTRVDRVGLAGVQDKVSAAMVNLPVARAGERYILKLTPPEYPYLVDNEAFFIAAARRVGIEVVDATVMTDIDGARGLLVRRFDRRTSDDGQTALAVEDGCQVLNRHPAAKYAVSTEEVFGALSQLCGSPVVAARTFLSQLAFAFVIGNGDAHAKNFSIVQNLEGEWWPAPAYDLPSSQPYGDATLALTIGGRRDAQLPAGTFVELARQLGIPERASRKVCAEVANKADLWLPDLGDLPFDSGRIRKLRRVIDRRRVTLARG